MRLSKPLSRTARRISLTPLIDIVFILLLFFILESNFLRFGELVFNSPRPDPPGSSDQVPIDVQVFADGQIWLEGRTLNPATLDAYLAQQQFERDTPVLIRAEDALPVQLLVRVVDVFQGRSLARLQFLPLEE